MSQPIYLDYNATTPIAGEVAAAMRPFLEGCFGNPSSSHRYGIEARRAVERARRQVAELLGAEPDEIVFTSGGSEANNTAILGTVWTLKDRGRHIVTSSIEHPAVTEVCRFLEGEGWRITRLPVDATGRVDPADVERALSSETILVTVMHANNEVGTIQPIAEIARRAHARGVRVHTDAAQSVGKIPVRVDALGVDLLSIAGHKLYAPKGIGALYIRRGTALAKLIHGASHEQDRRAGTENVLEIVGLGAAAEIAARDLERNATHMRSMRDRLHQALATHVPGMHPNGHPDARLPNTLSVSFPGLEANTILDELDEVAASAGAACHADQITISHVLTAMGVPERTAMGTIRLSVGRETTAEEIDRAARRIVEVIERLRGTDEPELEAGAGASRLIAPDEAGALRLTRFTHGLGCACKLRPQALEEVLAHLPRAADPALLVGTETSDDAAVYRIAPDLAIVETVDFFTPIVDDPRAFGAIAAANALSDIYAMGARPLFALNLVGFPVRRLPLAVLHEILRGASEKAAEAGIPIAGGHSVDDPEPKFGMAVTGIVHPEKILTNCTARPGDGLVLTKPIGLGILATAAKRGAASETAVTRAIAVMAALNKTAAETMARFPVSACTDVTGFGLIGHLLEMTTGSGVDAELWASAVPVLEEALEWAQAGVVPGGTRDNLDHAGARVTWDARLSPPERLLLCDAQTSGGLLIALPEADAPALLAALHEAGVGEAAIIGRMSGPGAGTIRVQRART
jgi:cysteine desulfurase NifS/selenium donor protein